MAEAPKRVEAVTQLFVVDDESVFRHGTHGAREGDTVLVTARLYQQALRRADIADGYRAALEDIAKILADPPKTAWIKIDTAAALAREALAKGDEA